ncbi:hypothetical protein PVK06_017513 [Gossypium arboreum]|uniref:Myosin motor domain-containing protein n=1 Tax=Gossypium arboreum TaxID=29729 RepID=A0ABR0Q3D4_GOSAR|nr:hypothetical protein PVK06_017513 [Gossypium arboreum]
MLRLLGTITQEGRISGAAIRSYLLERSRVCQVSDPKRNYHCFYMLCTAPPELIREEESTKKARSASTTKNSTSMKTRKWSVIGLGLYTNMKTREQTFYFGLRSNTTVRSDINCKLFSEVEITK